MFDSQLTLTGVIATLISVVFAVAAFMNSRRARQARRAPPPPGPDTLAAEKNPRPAGAPIHFEDDTQRGSLFKKVGPSGRMTDTVPATEHAYSWE
ncbi:MAG: hypothetical protein K9N49_04585 [Candidatus Marinimicrobia bacterium]|nr:hypothetical protein [Candidatus Neomarinimicrobiota bacterium]